MKKYNRIIALVIVTMMTLALIAACGNQYETAAPTPAPTAAPTAAPATAAPGQPEPAPAREFDPNNVLRFGTTSLDGAFNPIMSSNIYDSYVASLIFEGLVTNDHSGEFIPNIADWEISSDHLTYTFTLFEGIHFSDGVPLTARDVEFTYKALGHPDYSGVRTYVVADFEGFAEFRAGETDEFTGIKVIDERTISFTFAEGTASPANISNFGFGIMPEHHYSFNVWDEFLALLANPLGSGWFVFEEWRDKEFLMLHTNFNYWNPDEMPLIDGVLFVDIPNESLPGAFASNQVDLANPAVSVDAYNAFNAIPGVYVQTIAGNSYNFMQFNTNQPQLEDHRVRQALLYALDREAFVEAAYGPFGQVGMSPISPVSWAYNPEGMNAYAFDLERAAELMDEAGWTLGSDGIRQKDGMRMQISWLVYPEAPWPGILSSLAADTWAQLGVDLRIENMDFNTVGALTMDADVADRDFYMFTMGWSMAIDPDLTGGIFGLDEGALGDGGFNASGWHNEEGARLMEAAKQEFNQAKRAEMYQELSAMFNYYVPTVVVALRSVMWVNSERVGNLDISTYVDWTYYINKITLN